MTYHRDDAKRNKLTLLERLKSPKNNNKSCTCSMKCSLDRTSILEADSYGMGQISVISASAGDFEKRLLNRLGIQDTGHQTFEKIFPALARLKGLKHLDLTHIAPLTGQLWEPLATLDSLEFAGISLAVMKTEVCPSITKLSKPPWTLGLSFIINALSDSDCSMMLIF